MDHNGGHQGQHGKAYKTCGKIHKTSLCRTAHDQSAPSAAAETRRFSRAHADSSSADGDSEGIRAGTGWNQTEIFTLVRSFSLS